MTTKKNIGNRQDITQTILDHSNDAIIMIKNDPYYTIESWNNGAQKIYGWTEEEIVGKSSSIFENEYIGVDPKEALGDMNSMGIYKGEVIQKKKDGKKVYIHTSITGVKEQSDKISHWICINKDISFERGKLSDVKKEKDMLQTMFDSMPYGVILVGMDKKIQSLNRSAMDLIGHLNQEELQGQICHEIFCPADKDKCPILDLKQNVDRSERILVNKEKKEIPILKSVTPIEIKGEKVLLETFLDISHLKKIEKELKESEEKFRSIFNKSKLGIFILNLDGSFYDVNDKTLEIFGYDKDEFLNKNITDLHPTYAHSKMKEKFELLLKNEVDTIELDAIRKDGEIFILQITPSVLEIGNKKLVHGVVEDVTERRKSKMELRRAHKITEMIIQESPLGIIIYDDLGQCILANLASANLVGATREQLLQQNYHKIESWKKSGLYQVATEAIKVGQNRSLEVELTTTFDKEVAIQVFFIPFLLDNKNYLLLMVNDVTLKKEEEKEKDIIQKKLFQASKMATIGELAAGVGHEINNPLAIINGYIGVIKKYFLKNNLQIEMIDEAIGAQKSAVARIKNVIEGLRTFSAEQETIDELEVLDINEINSNLLSFLNSLYEKDDIKIEILKEAPYCEILGHKEKYRQIITNILNNARDALRGVKDKKIVIENKVTNDDKAVIRISDNGSGIEADKLPRIFDAFFTTKEIGQATGLGLTVTKNLVSNLGGKIEVYSIPKEGTSFVLSFPIVKDIAKKKQELKDKIKGRALLVEDEGYLRKILKELLQDFGLQVDLAGNGEMGLQLVDQNQYDYILTDLKMPVLDGEEMIKKIREIGKFKGKIFVLTGVMDRDVSKMSVDGYLRKPFDEDVLFEFLKKHII